MIWNNNMMMMSMVQSGCTDLDGVPFTGITNSLDRRLFQTSSSSIVDQNSSSLRAPLSFLSLDLTAESRDRWCSQSLQQQQDRTSSLSLCSLSCLCNILRLSYLHLTHVVRNEHCDEYYLLNPFVETDKVNVILNRRTAITAASEKCHVVETSIMIETIICYFRIIPLTILKTWELCMKHVSDWLSVALVVTTHRSMSEWV